MSEEKEKEKIKQFFTKVLDNQDQKDIVNLIIDGKNFEEIVESFIGFKEDRNLDD